MEISINSADCDIDMTKFKNFFYNEGVDNNVYSFARMLNNP